MLLLLSLLVVLVAPSAHWRFINQIIITVIITNNNVVGMSPGWAPLRNGLGQAVYTCVPLSVSSITWYRPRGVIPLVGKVTAAWWEVMAAYHPVYE